MSILVEALDGTRTTVSRAAAERAGTLRDWLSSVEMGEGSADAFPVPFGGTVVKSTLSLLEAPLSVPARRTLVAALVAGARTVPELLSGMEIANFLAADELLDVLAEVVATRLNGLCGSMDSTLSAASKMQEMLGVACDLSEKERMRTAFEAVSTPPLKEALAAPYDGLTSEVTADAVLRHLEFETLTVIKLVSRLWRERARTCMQAYSRGAAPAGGRPNRDAFRHFWHVFAAETAKCASPAKGKRGLSGKRGDLMHYGRTGYLRNSTGDARLDGYSRR